MFKQNLPLIASAIFMLMSCSNANMPQSYSPTLKVSSALSAAPSVTQTNTPAPTTTIVATPDLKMTEVIATMQVIRSTIRAESFKSAASITLESKGQTFTTTLGSRFFVYLDDEENYPARRLKCEPEGIIGWISNGAFNGPDRYPYYYEAGQVGSCILKNGDFTTTIIVIPRKP